MKALRPVHYYVAGLAVATVCAAAALLWPQSEDRAQVKATVPSDSIVRLALLPTLDCLPYFVASEQGVFDSLGLHVSLQLLPSQLNCEKALTEGRADLCATDAFRTMLLQAKKKPIRLHFATHRTWRLVSNRSLRLTKASQLGGRIVAAPRQSVMDYQCDLLEQKASAKDGPMLRAQINSVFVRQQMLINNQVHAALLPEPQATVACALGQTALAFKAETDGWSGMACHSGLCHSERGRQLLAKLREAYDLGVRHLQRKAEVTLSRDLRAKFHIPSDTISLSMAALKPATPFGSERLEMAQSYLRDHQLLPTGYTIDTLTVK